MSANIEKRDFIFYVWLFFLLAFFGWVWEGCLYLFKDGMYVNRGVLKGPWLPIYGAGGVMLELFLHRWRKKPVPVFFISALLCSLAEYLAGWYLEAAWGVMWWDYSGMKWNLQGRVCLTSTLLFGVGGVVLICIAAPLYRRVYEKIPAKIRVACGLLLVLLFAADAAYSAIAPHVGRGITYLPD